MQKLAKKFGGKCLSTEYVNATSPLKWQCQHGHQWEATPIYISDAEIWCKKCNRQKKAATTLVHLQKIAKKNGGECLSKKYINMKSPMRWQCKNGHIWTTRPDRIVEGRWCPKCYDNRRHKKVKKIK